jgi:hypothetical protein
MSATTDYRGTLADLVRHLRPPDVPDGYTQHMTGVVVWTLEGDRFLVGDVNPFMGSLCCCDPAINDDAEVVAYLRVWDPES